MNAAKKGLGRGLSALFGDIVDWIIFAFIWLILSNLSKYRVFLTSPTIKFTPAKSILAFKSDNALIFLQNYQIFVYLLGLALLLLSVRGIKKDQNLIDSIDRIR